MSKGSELGQFREHLQLGEGKWEWTAIFQELD